MGDADEIYESLDSIPHIYVNAGNDENFSSTYSVYSTSDAEKDYVNSLTGVRDGRERGPQLQKTYSCNEDPNELSDAATEELRDSYPTCSADDRPEVCSRVLWRVLPRLLRDHKLDMLASFLKINDDTIQKEVMNALFHFLFTSNSVQQQTQQYLAVEEEVWKTLTRSHCRLQRCHLATLDAILWACLLLHHADFPNLDSQLEQRLKERLQGLQNLETTGCCQTSLRDLRHFLEIRRLHFASPSSRNKVDVKDFARKSKPSDRLIFLYQRLFELNTSTIQRGTHEELEFALEEFRKLKDRDKGGIFLLQLIFIQGINQALLNKFKNEEVLVGHAKPRLPTLMRATKGCVESCRKPKYVEIMLEVLATHAFHSDSRVKEDVLYLFNKFDRNNPMPRLEVKQVELLLRKGRFQVEETSVRHCPESGGRPPCVWREFRGHVDGPGGRETMRGYVLSHGSKCLIDKDYNSCCRPSEVIHNLDILLRLDPEPVLTMLVAYQIMPFPPFYLVKDYSHDDKLLSRILQRRNDKDWFSWKELGTFALDVLSALQHLHSRGIVLRDLTPYSLVLAEQHVQVTEFGSAMEFRDRHQGEMLKDLDPKGVPLRWMGSESLWKGCFSPATDVYAVGMTLYQLFTHGLEPFSELYTNDLEIIVHAILTSVAPMHWPCIPDQVHNLILQCVQPQPQDRPSLERVRKTLIDLFEDPSDKDRRIRPPIQELWRRTEDVPRLDESQILRKHVPEKGVPKFMTQRRQKTSEAEYKNLGDQIYQVRGQTKTHQVSHWDSPVVKTEGDVTKVVEPMTHHFAFHVLPQLQVVQAQCLELLEPYSEPEASASDRDRFRQTRLYPACDKLLDVALHCGRDIKRLLQLLQRLAEAVAELHHRGCVYRDLSASSVLVTRKKDMIRLPRLNRMRKLDMELEERERRVATDIRDFPDRWRWLPCEVLVAGQFYPSSDVYMWAVTAWEALHAADFYTKNPNRLPAELLPFHRVSDDQLRNRSLCNVDLQKPLLCPEQVFAILERCWRRDRHQRPSMADVVADLQQIVPTLRSWVPRPVPIPMASSEPRGVRRKGISKSLKRHPESVPVLQEPTRLLRPRPRSAVFASGRDEAFRTRVSGQVENWNTRELVLTRSDSETRVKDFYLSEDCPPPAAHEFHRNSRYIAYPSMTSLPSLPSPNDLDSCTIPKTIAMRSERRTVSFSSVLDLQDQNEEPGTELEWELAEAVRVTSRGARMKKLVKAFGKKIVRPFTALKSRKRSDIRLTSVMPTGQEGRLGLFRATSLHTVNSTSSLQHGTQDVPFRASRYHNDWLSSNSHSFRDSMPQPLYSSSTDSHASGGNTIETMLGNPDSNAYDTPYIAMSQTARKEVNEQPSPDTGNTIETTVGNPDSNAYETPYVATSQTARQEVDEQPSSDTGKEAGQECDEADDYLKPCLKMPTTP